MMLNRRRRRIYGLVATEDAGSIHDSYHVVRRQGPPDPLELQLTYWLRLYGILDLDLLRLRRLRSGSLLALAILCAAFNYDSASAQSPPCTAQVPPSEQFGELFQKVQLKRIFPRRQNALRTYISTSHRTNSC